MQSSHEFKIDRFFYGESFHPDPDVITLNVSKTIGDSSLSTMSAIEADIKSFGDIKKLVGGGIFVEALVLNRAMKQSEAISRSGVPAVNIPQVPSEVPQ